MATRFWVGGAGTWDSSTTTHWAATTGGAGGQSVPGSADTVTFDGSSGGGTVTVNFGGTVTVQSITCGAFTGTLDFSANNNSVTLSSTTGFNGSGSGTRTINLGNGTWTLSGASQVTTPWNMATTTGLTFSANSSTVSMTGTITNGTMTFAGGGLTYSTVSFAANRGGWIISGANTFATLTISAGALLYFTASTTYTVTNAFTFTGTASLPITIITNATNGNVATISVASGTPGGSWCCVRGITCTGGATFTFNNSLDCGLNTGSTINAPSAGAFLANSPVILARGTPY